MKHTLTYNPPIGTLGELMLELERFMHEHPNPTEDDRCVRIHVTMGGRIKQIEVDDAKV